MPPRSNIETKLTDQQRAQLHRMLDDPKYTRSQIAAAINSEAGADILSTSGVNRYALKWAEMTERSRRAKEAAEIWQSKLGVGTSNILGRVLNEQLRVLLMDMPELIDDLRNSEDVDVEVVTASLYKVARTLKSLEESDRINAEREAEIRNETLDAAAKVVGDQARSSGLSEKTAEEFRRIVLGLKNG